jgi:hypothetical protein
MSFILQEDLLSNVMNFVELNDLSKYNFNDISTTLIDRHNKQRNSVEKISSIDDLLNILNYPNIKFKIEDYNANLHELLHILEHKLHNIVKIMINVDYFDYTNIINKTICIKNN